MNKKADCQYMYLWLLTIIVNELYLMLHLMSNLQHYHHHHQPLTMTMMMPGLTEEECQRYQELLEIKYQYERHLERRRRELEKETTEAEVKGREEGDEAAEEAEGTASESVVDVNSKEMPSEHELALIEEELRHLEFKCRNILRAQKMQQLRERCLKAWMMEEETVAGGAGRPGPSEGGNNQHQGRKHITSGRL